MAEKGKRVSTQELGGQSSGIPKDTECLQRHFFKADFQEQKICYETEQAFKQMQIFSSTFCMWGNPVITDSRMRFAYGIFNSLLQQYLQNTSHCAVWLTEPPFHMWCLWGVLVLAGVEFSLASG